MFGLSEAEKVEQLIKVVGEYIRNERNHFNSSSVEHKDIHDMVSYVDKTSEEKLIDGLQSIIPGSSFLAEETGILENSSMYKWIIDPLDGTTNFIHNIPHYCISVGLQHNDQTIAGWVYEICNNEMYFGFAGNGAFMNKIPIRVTKTSELHQSLMGTGFPVREFEKLKEYLLLQQWMIENTRGIRRLGTAAYDLCLVASGRFEAFYEPGLSEWDVTAGSLIVEEAGGKVTDFHGERNFLFGKQILASNGTLHEQLLKAVQIYL